jgi:hypothetical protein
LPPAEESTLMADYGSSNDYAAGRISDEMEAHFAPLAARKSSGIIL